MAKVKVSSVLDQADDSEILSLEVTEVRTLAVRDEQYNSGIVFASTWAVIS